MTTQNFKVNCQPIEMISADRQNPMMNQDEITDELSRLEDIIHEKIDDIKKVIHDQDKWVAEEIAMKKQTSSQLLYPKYDKKVCYYQQFWKIYLMNQIMISKIKDYSVSNKDISGKIEELQEAEKQWSAIWAQKSKKKIRRTSDMIQKNYECPFPNCGKIYGTDVALNGHMKIKHNSGTKTQREALARQICLAEQRGEKININLTFPPGYLQKFKQNFRRQQN